VEVCNVVRFFSMCERIFSPIETDRQLIEVLVGGLLRECNVSENGAERTGMVESTPMIIVPGSQVLRGRM
jgi:hypothetical protein